MSKKIELLKKETENQRNILTKLALKNNNDFQIREVLVQSTYLDTLIVEYQKFLKKSKEKKIQLH